MISNIKENEYISSDIRVAVVGNVDSGKSTIIGVLSGGIYDDGRGLARQRVFVHPHEHENGRTSCISQQILGFKDSKPIFNKSSVSSTSIQKNKSYTDVINNSDNIITFIDLAGHEKYLGTTVEGLTSNYPDYSMIIINSLAGITRMTKEHLGLSILLKIPFFIVISKIDLVPDNVLKDTKKQISKILKSKQVGKMPLVINEVQDIKTVLMDSTRRICPIFFVSSVQGNGLDLLNTYLSQIKSTRKWDNENNNQPIFKIDSKYDVKGIGLVIGGFVYNGTITEKTTMLLGPMNDKQNRFIEVNIKSIQSNRIPIKNATVGNSCGISIVPVNRKIILNKKLIKKGMVLIDTKSNLKPSFTFEARVLILHHSSTIKKGYQAYTNCGNISQAVIIENICKEDAIKEETNILRTGDTGIVQFRFLKNPELLQVGEEFVFREGTTKGTATVTKVYNDDIL
jgi:GTPase